MKPTRTFDAFLSYNSLDHEAVLAVAQALKERELRPFVDRWEFVPGENWAITLELRVADCRASVVFIGPHGMGRWQQRERIALLDRQTLEAGFRVIPVLLPGAKDPSLGFLSQNMWIDLRQGVNDPATLDLMARAIRGEAAENDSVFTKVRSEISPYRGLQAFREEDSAFFFGREAFVEEMLGKLRRHDFLMVLGASGSGKSSVVRAGLIPELRRGAKGPDGREWSILTIRPGEEPLQELANAFDPPCESLGLFERQEQLNIRAEKLRNGAVSLGQLTRSYLGSEPGSQRLLLFIDQFEELYTHSSTARKTSDEPSADAVKRQDQDIFLDIILDAIGTTPVLTVIGTMRADFLGHALERRDLAEILRDTDIKIGPLDREPRDDGMNELEEIILRPAEAVGLSFEHGLVGTVMSAIDGEPGDLPLLEYLLKGLWTGRRGHEMTHAAFDKLGGVRGAISAAAQDAYESFTDEEQDLVRRLFLSLVTLGEGQEDTRARAPIPSDPGMAHIIDTFADADLRLLVTNDDPTLGPVVEVSHEALIRNWPKLRGWIDGNRDLLRMRDRVRRKMEQWTGQENAIDLLLRRGVELDEGRRLLEASKTIPIGDIEDYITASVGAEESARRADKDRLDRERQMELKLLREAKRRSWISAITACALAVLGAFSLYSAFIANEQKREAVANETSALGALSKIAYEENRYHDAARLALSAWPEDADDERPRDETAREVLEDVVADLRKSAHIAGHEDGITDADFAPDGDRVITWSVTDPAARIWSVETGEQLAALDGHDGGVAGAVFSKDGRFLATFPENGAVRLWDQASAEPLAGFADSDAGVSSVAFSDDGARLLVVGKDGMARLWNIDDRTLITRIGGPDRRIDGALFNGAGDRIVAWSQAVMGAWLFDGETGAEMAALTGHGAIPNTRAGLYTPILKRGGAAFSPDGRRLVTWFSGDTRARLWDGMDGAPVRTLDEAGGVIAKAFFNDDGSRLVVFTRSNGSLLTNGATGVSIVEFNTLSGVPTFVANGNRLLTGTSMSTYINSKTGKFSGATRAVGNYSNYSINTTKAISARFAVQEDLSTGALHLHDILDDQRITTLRAQAESGPRSPYSGYNSTVRLTDDERHLLTWSSDPGSARIWKLAALLPEIRFSRTGRQPPSQISVSPDGKLLIAQYADEIVVLDAADVSEIRSLPVSGTGSALAQAQGGRLLLRDTAKSAIIYDLADRVVLARIFRDDDATLDALALLSNGTEIVTATSDGFVTIRHLNEQGIAISDRFPVGSRVWAITKSAQNDRAFLRLGQGASKLLILNESKGNIVLDLPETKELFTSTDNTALYSANTGFALFSPNGSRLLLVGSQAAHIYDTNNGEQLAILETDPAANIAGYTFSDDNSQIFGWDGLQFIVWGTASGEIIDRRSPRLENGLYYSSNVQFSSSGEYAAVFGSFGYSTGAGGTKWDSKVHIFDVNKGISLSVLEYTGGGSLNDIEFSKDKNYLFTTGNDGTLRLWDWRQQKEISRHTGATSPIQNVEMGTTAALAMILHLDGVAAIWDVARDTKISEIASGDDNIVGGHLHPNEKTVLTWTWNGVLSLSNARTGTKIAQFAPSDGKVISASFEPQQKRVLAFLSNGTIQILKAHDLTPVSNIAGHSEGSLGATFADDDTVVTWSATDSTMREWNAATGQERRIHDTSGPLFSASLHPDGKRLMLYYNDGKIDFRDRETGKETAQYRPEKSINQSFLNWSGIPSFNVSGDGRSALLVSTNPYSSATTATVMDMKTGSTAPPIELSKTYMNIGLSFLDGGKSVYASLNGNPRVWDAATGIAHSDTDPRAFPSSGNIWTSESGRRLLVRSKLGNWQLRNGETGTLIGTLKNSHNAQDFKVVGERVWMKTAKGAVKLWDMTDGDIVGTVRAGFGDDTMAAPAPLGDRVLVWARGTSRATLRSLREPQFSVVLEGHDAAISGARFSPDGKRVMTWSLDRTARLWDAVTGKEINRFTEHRGAVRGGMFSADGTRVMTWSSDRKVILWEAENAKVIMRLPHEAVVQFADFAADGTRILTQTVDGISYLWRVPDGEEIARFGRSRYSTTNKFALPDRFDFDASESWFMVEDYTSDKIRLHDAEDASLIREFPRENWRYLASHHASNAKRFIVHGSENLHIRDTDGAKLAVIERKNVQSRLAADGSFALVWSDTQSHVERWELGDVSSENTFDLICKLARPGTGIENVDSFENRCKTPQKLPTLRDDMRPVETD